MNAPENQPTASDISSPPARVGAVHGTAVIRDAEGNVKETFEFHGETTLSESELREALFS